jgi:hypothetical protein
VHTVVQHTSRCSFLEEAPEPLVLLRQLFQVSFKLLHCVVLVLCAVLQVCADTQVGNNMIRGVSGGQRKRVTTGEVGVSGQQTVAAGPPAGGL